MKSKLAVACAALLALVAGPAAAVQLGQIEIRSALNQPLVAAIPVHPKNLTELEGLSVGLASSADFARAGLAETATDKTLRFHLVTDNNGQKLILITSSEPITDPYLDFLVQVNTRQGKEVREFVVLLNPTIAAPAPEVQSAPVAGAPSPAPTAAPPPVSAEAVPELPAPPPQVAAPPAPVPQVPPPLPPPVAPQRQSAPAATVPIAAAKASSHQPSAAPQSAANVQARPGGEITVKRGDTLSGIASGIAPGSGASIDQVMLALQAANPKAFFGKNINNLKAGAILRVPARDALSEQSVAAAAATVRRQHESWQAVRAHPATLLEGTAEAAAAKAAPVAAPPAATTDHLTLAPATGNGAAGTTNRPGVAGGTGTGAAAGLGSSIQSQRDTLLSLDQSNSELQERVRRLDDLSQKTGRLLSLKDSEVAELQRNLAAIQAGAAAHAEAPAPTVRSAAKAGVRTVASPWYMRPLTWVIGALVVLLIIVLGLLGRRGRAPRPEPARGPLADPDDLRPEGPGPGATVPFPPEAVDSEAGDPSAVGPEAIPPENVQAEGASIEAEAGDIPPAPVAAPQKEGEFAAAASEVVDGPVDEVVQVPADDTGVPASMDVAGTGDGGALPDAAADSPRLDERIATDAEAGNPPAPVLPGASPSSAEPAALEPVPVAPVPMSQTPDVVGRNYRADPVDLKLDLARAYLDMGDQTGARTMLDEVLAHGSQVQQDEARRILAEATE